MAYTVCPHCRQAFELPEAPLYPAAWQAAERRTFSAGAADLAGVAEYIKEQPTRAADPLADVFVPLLQAVICAGAAAMVTAVFADSWRLPAVVGVVTFGLAWLTLLRLSIARLSVRERIVKEPGPEPAPKHITRLSFAVDGYPRQAELAIEPDRLLVVARACANGRPFSERSLAGRGGPLTGRAQYEAVRDFLLGQSWLEWKDSASKNLGLQWTRPGEAAIRALSSGRISAEDMLD